MHAVRAASRTPRIVPWLLFAGLVLHSSRASAAVDGDWTLFDPPPGVIWGTAIFDPVRERMVVFGGNLTSSVTNGVWTLSLGAGPAWSRLAPSGTPPPGRTWHAAIYDPVRDRMLVFGGIGFDYQNDVWALSLGPSPAWTHLAPVGTPPPARAFPAVIYDPVRDRMLVFAGQNGESNFNDVWQLSLGDLAWSELSPAGTPPAARTNTTAVYDPVRDRMLIFGGFGGGFLQDVWELPLAGSPAWNQLSPAGAPPPARTSHSAIYDPVHDRVLVFGGWDGSNQHDDTWSLALAGTPTWSELSSSTSAPAARSAHASIYDPLQHRMLVFAGQDESTHNHNDVWALALVGEPGWNEVMPDAPPPAGLEGPSAIHDPVRHRMVIFGGFADQIGYERKIWTLSLGANPTWSLLTPSGSGPDARNRHAAIYDPVRDRMLVFGGTEGFSLNDVWALSLAGSPAWTPLAPGGGPPGPRFGHTAVYDPVRDRMLVFGGFAQGIGYSNEVWALSLAGAPTWNLLAPSGTPPSGRDFHSAIYDPARDRMVVYGGSGFSGANGDAWALTLSGSPAWSLLAPSGTPPAPRYWHSAIFDPVRDRMVVFAGFLNISDCNETWALSFAATPSWAQLAPGGAPPAARRLHVATYDPDHDRMAIFGGSSFPDFHNDVGFLAWGPLLPVPGEGVPRVSGLGPPRPNPSQGETTFEFDVPVPARVTLEVFDTQGRRVRQLADAWLPAGPHTRVWRGDDDEGRMLGAGVYFICMRSGSFRSTRRLFRIR